MNDRVGDHLWHEWDGELYQRAEECSVVYYTLGHIDLSVDVVRRGLASAVQRDGVLDSLGVAFSGIESARVEHGWCGLEDEDSMELVACDEHGETFYGDLLENVQEITFVEFKCF